MTIPDSRIWGRWLPVLLSSLLLAWLVSRVDGQGLRMALGDLRLGPLAVAVAAFGGLAALEVERLRTVFAALGLRYAELWRLHMVGLFYGAFLPGQLGADAYKVAVLRKAEGGLPAVLLRLLLLRLIGVLPLLAAAFLLWPWAGRGHLILERLDWRQPWWWAGGALAMALPILFLWRVPAWRRRMGRLLDQGRRAIGSVTRRQVLRLVWLSVGILGVRAVVLGLLASAAGQTLDPVSAVLVISLATLATLLPISFAGLGVREGVITGFLTASGVAYESALLVAAASRALLWLFSLLGGLWLISAGRWKTPEKDRAAD